MSYREGLPRNIMELMAYGKPVVGTNIRGIRDLISDGENGFLVDVGDIDGTVSAIELLYKDKKKLNLMSEKSYIAIKDYSIENVLGKLLNIYTKL